MFKFGSEVDVLCMNPLAPVMRMRVEGIDIRPTREGAPSVTYRAVYRGRNFRHCGYTATMLTRVVRDYDIGKTMFEAGAIPTGVMDNHLASVRDMVNDNFDRRRMHSPENDLPNLAEFIG